VNGFARKGPSFRWELTFARLKSSQVVSGDADVHQDTSLVLYL